MPNIIMIHGAYGNSEENWFPWLKKELEESGYSVYVPNFPTPDNQSLDKWLKVFQEYRRYINEDTIMIGHSLGPSFILKILEEEDKSIKACYFVAGFTGLLDLEIDEINRTFVERKFDWDKIVDSCKNFYIYSSDNDPYVPLSKAEDLTSNLKTNLELIKGAGHFNSDSGYDTFESLLEDIKTRINQ